jgi:predicted SnoaL-like aldol condensation-catalyzing enzyme
MKDRLSTAAAIFAGLALMAGAAQAASPPVKEKPPSAAELKAKWEQEQKAKAVVLGFWHAVFEEGDISKAKDYYAPGIIQHNPIVPSGLQGFLDTFSRRWPKPLDPDKVVRTKFVKVMVNDDMVNLIYAKQRTNVNDPTKTYESFWFDMFRVKDGMIVEHWDPQIIPGPGQPRL